MSKLREKLTFSNVSASLALFAALSGVAVAAGLPKNSVGPKQLKKGAVTAAKIKKGAVTSGKLGAKSVVAGKLGPNAVTPGNIVNGGITTAKIGAGAVIASSIKNGVITTNKLANANLTTAKLADGAVTSAKLGPEVAPLLGTLRSGQTLRGSFDIGAETKVVRAGQSFQFPLTNPPGALESNVLKTTESNAACPGLKGGNAQTPEAVAGQLCVYYKLVGGEEEGKPAFSPGSVNRLGFGLVASFKAADAKNEIQGFWAVTAP